MIVHVPMLGLTNGHEYMLRFGVLAPNLARAVDAEFPSLHDEVAYMPVVAAADHVATVTSGLVVGVDHYRIRRTELDETYDPEVHYEITMWNTSSTAGAQRVVIPGDRVVSWVDDMESSGHWNVQCITAVAPGPQIPV